MIDDGTCIILDTRRCILISEIKDPPVYKKEPAHQRVHTKNK